MKKLTILSFVIVLLITACVATPTQVTPQPTVGHSTEQAMPAATEEMMSDDEMMSEDETHEDDLQPTDSDMPVNTASVDVKYDFPIAVYQGFENNETLQFSDIFQDGKPVVVNFWAPLCPSCVIEMDDLEQIYQAKKDEVNFAAVDIGSFLGLGNKSDALALIAEKQLTFPAGSTPDVEVIRQYTVLGTPTTVFFNSDGSIGEVWTGILTFEQFNDFIGELY